MMHMCRRFVFISNSRRYSKRLRYLATTMYGTKPEGNKLVEGKKFVMNNVFGDFESNKDLKMFSLLEEIHGIDCLDYFVRNGGYVEKGDIIMTVESCNNVMTIKAPESGFIEFKPKTNIIFKPEMQLFTINPTKLVSKGIDCVISEKKTIKTIIVCDELALNNNNFEIFLPLSNEKNIKWRYTVKDGSNVKVDDVVMEIELELVTIDIRARKSGVIKFNKINEITHKTELFMIYCVL